MKKKSIIALLLAMIMVFSLCSCGESDPIVGTYSEANTQILDWHNEDDYLGSFNGDYYFTDAKFVFNEDGTVKITVLNREYDMIAQKTYMQPDAEDGNTYYGTWEKTDIVEPLDSNLFKEERTVYQISQGDFQVFKVWFIENPEEYTPDIVADLGNDTYMQLSRDSE